MPTRGLTGGERAILKFVFGDSLIQYTLITTNDANRGGEDNSITYTDIPHYSKKIWCPDFSAANAETWTFVHEFGHVWQFRYATHPISWWLQNVMRHPVHYDLNYYYDMMKSDDFYDYNIEQQASMVADYWSVSVSKGAVYCTNPKPPQREDYYDFISQVQNPTGPTKKIEIPAFRSDLMLRRAHSHSRCPRHRFARQMRNCAWRSNAC